MKKTLFFIYISLIILVLFSCNNQEESKNNIDNHSLTLKIESKEYNAGYNLAGDLGDLVVYDREYINIHDGSITLDVNHSDRKLYRVSVDEDNVFTVKESISLEEAIIPMNGLLLSFAVTSVEIIYNTTVTLENYNHLEFETNDFCTFSVNGDKRRIYLKDPTVELDKDIIVLITSEYGKEYTLNQDEVAYSIIKEKNGTYYVGEKIDGVVPQGTYGLIFTGKYNIAFAEEVMLKDEKISFKSLNAANSFVYYPSVEIDNDVYNLSNPIDIDKEGIYLFDCTYEKYAIPKFKTEFVSAVVIDDKISVIGELNEQQIIPNNNGYVLVFVGDKYIPLVEENKKIKPILVDPTTSKESDIILEYSSVSKTINGIDQTRGTDNLIVYTPAFGKTTKTNEWGCEIAVDKNGLMVDFSSAGNMEIPEGGFVLSAHGEMINWLKDNYLYGAKVDFNSARNNVTISVTPLSTISSIKKSYEILKSNYDNALKTYREFDVEELDKLITEAKSFIDSTNDSDLTVAVEAMFAANKAIKNASNMYFSSSTVENRAVWYAPTEKNEAEVKKTIELIKSLNINALYIETWRSGQTIYKTTLDMTFQESTFRGFDVLEAFVRLGHENGIEIHAWVHDFFVGTDYHKSVNGHVLNLHPDWALKTRSGSVYNPTGYGNFMFLNPYKRECRDLVLGVYREILENYDVDGLHLDYIRFPEPNSSNEDWGYNDDIIAAFQAEYNTTIDPRKIYTTHSMWDEWCKFRENIITTFVGEVYEMIQAVDPNIWLSAAIYPDMHVTPKTIFQNFVPWVNNGWMDEIFAMSYASSADTVIDVSNNFLNAINGKCFYSAGIGAFAQYDDVAYLEQIEMLRNTTAVGTNIFSLASVNGNNLMKLLQETVYRNKTVQVYDTECVYTYIQSMIERCDGVYTKSDLTEKDLDELKKLLSEALDEVENVVLINNDRNSKKVFFESLKPIVEAIDVTAFEAKDSMLYKALESQLDSLIRIIDTNINIFS